MIKAREEKNSADIPLRILQSAIIVLALFAKIRVLPHDGSEYPIIAFLAKTRDSFEEMSFASPLVFILFLLLLLQSLVLIENKSLISSSVIKQSHTSFAFDLDNTYLSFV